MPNLVDRDGDSHVDPVARLEHDRLGEGVPADLFSPGVRVLTDQVGDLRVRKSFDVAPTIGVMLDSFRNRFVA